MLLLCDFAGAARQDSVSGGEDGRAGSDAGRGQVQAENLRWAADRRHDGDEEKREPETRAWRLVELPLPMLPLTLLSRLLFLLTPLVLSIVLLLVLVSSNKIGMHTV